MPLVCPDGYKPNVPDSSAYWCVPNSWLYCPVPTMHPVPSQDQCKAIVTPCQAGTHFDGIRCAADVPVACPDGYVNQPTAAGYFNCVPVAVAITAPLPLPALDGVGLLLTIAAVAAVAWWRSV